jgi:hypothetical protein
MYDTENMKTESKVVAITGLALGAIFGLLGTVATSQNLRAAAWGLDGTGIVAATALLAVSHFRKGDECVAAGFLVFAIGEGVILSGTAATLVGSVPSFGAGAALWSAGLLLTSIPKEFASWIRVAGTIGAVLFAITAARIFCGEELVPIASPLPFFAYPFLVLTLLGWIWTLMKGGGERA